MFTLSSVLVLSGELLRTMQAVIAPAPAVAPTEAPAELAAARPRTSTRITAAAEALDRLKPGPVNTPDARLSLPSRERVYHDMEALINSFKLVYEGVRPPPGTCYDATEATNGELGFMIVSDGGTNPYRVKVRPPCFTQFAAYGDMLTGTMLADVAASLGSINIIAGELDR